MGQGLVNELTRVCNIYIYIERERGGEGVRQNDLRALDSN